MDHYCTVRDTGAALFISLLMDVTSWILTILISLSSISAYWHVWII
ncbi:putative membrane protein [Escherichia coli DEC12C]|nr:putative membrane protein [Escherichia coli DEC12C]